MKKDHKFPLLIADNWQDYELIDSGNGHKFERFGKYKFIRPDSQAYWQPKNPIESWRADAIFTGKDQEDLGRWSYRNNIKEYWEMNWNDISFYARCTPFRHLGVFPEQSVHWEWCANKIKAANRPVKVLNLFGYTGIASLVCAQAGASVTHIDASKKSVQYGKENQQLSNLEDKPIRWIVEDALKFVEREKRRGNYYDGIIFDPPKHGRGPNGEVFKLEEQLFNLTEACTEILTENAIFMVATVYAVRLSFIALHNIFEDLLSSRNGEIESGEMAILQADGPRFLPTAIFTRWESSDNFHK